MSSAYGVLRVADLRKALEGLPDERLIVSQVVAMDGTAWNLAAEFCPTAAGGNVAVLSLTHPLLRTMPDPETVFLDTPATSV